MKSGETASTSEKLPLLERERELEALAAALKHTPEGTGSLLMVEGPAGIGKTSVLHEAAAHAQDEPGSSTPVISTSL